MLQGGEEPDLAKKTRSGKAGSDVVVKNFYRDWPVMKDIAREKNCRHAALTKLSLDTVFRRKAFPDRFNQVRSSIHRTEDERPTLARKIVLPKRDPPSSRTKRFFLPTAKKKAGSRLNDG